LSPTLENFPAQIGVESIVESIGVIGEDLVVGEGELHPADYSVEALSESLFGPRAALHRRWTAVSISFVRSLTGE